VYSGCHFCDRPAYQRQVGLHRYGQLRRRTNGGVSCVQIQDRRRCLGGSIEQVYSAGGANPAVLRALECAGQKPQTYIAHDLDGDNRTLLKSGKIDFVIYHELRQDARSCCQHILQALRLLPPEFKVAKSAIQLATPLNIPS